MLYRRISRSSDSLPRRFQAIPSPSPPQQAGTTAKIPFAEWDLNPDAIMVPAGGSVTLHPKLVSGSGTMTLGSPTSSGGITVTVAQSSITSSQHGAVIVMAGGTPGFYHFDVPATDNAGVTATEGGWIVVGIPPASLATTGDGQTANTGTTLPNPLTITLTSRQSGGNPSGASILFSTSAGSLSSGSAKGSKIVAFTNSSGVASVTLTLPGTPQSVQVTAEGPYALGHPQVIFNETAK